jgi:hypothetical protein
VLHYYIALWTTTRALLMFQWTVTLPVLTVLHYYVMNHNQSTVPWSCRRGSEMRILSMAAK